MNKRIATRRTSTINKAISGAIATRSFDNRLHK